MAGARPWGGQGGAVPLAGLEAQAVVMWELVLRRVVEVWLEGQRKEYGTQGTTSEFDGD